MKFLCDKSTPLEMIMKTQRVNSMMLVAAVFLFSLLHFSDTAKCKIPKSDQFVFRSDLQCDSSKVHLKCKKPKGGIKIYKATYGRPLGVSSKICLDESKNMTRCPATDVKEALSKLCNKKRHCGFKVDPKLFGLNDICPTVYKYLEVLFLCWKGYREKPVERNDPSEKLVTQGDGTQVEPITVISPDSETEEDITTMPTSDPCVDTETPEQTSTPATSVPTEKRTTPTPFIPKIKKNPDIRNDPTTESTFIFYQQRKSSVALLRQNVQFVMASLLVTLCALIYI